MRRGQCLLLLGVLFLAGCATSVGYVDYTAEQYAPKPEAYPVAVYTQPRPSDDRPYDVIGKVNVEGFASDGTTPELVSQRAQQVARRKGADAIINAQTQAIHEYWDILLRFQGDLIVYAPQARQK